MNAKQIVGVLSVVAGALVSAPLSAQAPVVEMGQQGKSSLESQLASLERKLDARNRAQIAIQGQLDELQNEVSELRGVTELHSHQLSQVLDRQRDLYQELERRVSEALQTRAAQPEPVPTAGGVNYSDNLNENDLYDRAVNLVLKEKRYDQAINEFEKFLKSFPESNYAANAHYWLGQLLFNKGNLKEAQSHFDTVVSRFADSSKRSDSMLKLGMVAQKLSNNAKARQIYQKLIQEYPDSSAANLAKTRLASLGN